MGGSSVTGVRLVVLATLASQTAALFSCFEWPSVVDPELTVRYISTDNCSHVRYPFPTPIRRYTFHQHAFL